MNVSKFKKLLSNELQECGFIKDTLKERYTLGLFYKKIDELILMLAVEMSAKNKGLFTGSFYLSRTFTWSYTPIGFPHTAYRRVGNFLNVHEREELLGCSYIGAGIVDAWWEGYSEDVLIKFKKAVQLSESRFLDQKDLLILVLDCEELMCSQKYSKLITDLAIGYADDEMHALTSEKIDDIYFRAAEEILTKYDSEWVNPDGIKFFVKDAWRYYNYIVLNA